MLASVREEGYFGVDKDQGPQDVSTAAMTATGIRWLPSGDGEATDRVLGW